MQSQGQINIPLPPTVPVQTATRTETAQLSAVPSRRKLEIAFNTKNTLMTIYNIRNSVHFFEGTDQSDIIPRQPPSRGGS